MPSLADNSTTILLSPKHEHLRRELLKLRKDYALEDHILLLSSGTTSAFPKGYALSREALRIHAQTVNRHLNMTSRDRWGLTLPSYHIGGLGILMRAQELGTQAAELGTWRPSSFTESLKNENVTVISLVPTQIYDLVKMKIEAPKNLHCVLAGGDFLGQELERKARDLGWPLVRTFGMTEVGSQLATGGDLKEGLKLLPVHQVKTDDDQRLWVKTPTLFTLEFSWREKWDVRYAKDKLDHDGFYPLQDRVELKGDRIIPRGRMDGAVKISGRLVQLYELKDQLDTFTLDHDCWGLLELNLKSDARQGFELELIHSPNVDSRIVEEFLQLVMPLKVSVVKKEIQRNELGKVLLNRPVF